MAHGIPERDQFLPGAALVAILLSACTSAAAPPNPRPTTSPTTSPSASAEPIALASPPAPVTASPSVAVVSEPSPLPPTVVRTPPPVTSPPAPAGTLPAGLRGVEWTRLPTSRKVVALTFDAGSMAQGVPSILDTLAREHVPGTFFLTGRWVVAYPDLARRIGAIPGDAVGNHTWDHTDLRGLSDAQVRAEIGDGEKWVQAETGRPLQPLFRFPYGGSDARVLGIANSMGYGSIRWTVDTLGWKGTSGGQSVDTVFNRAVGAAEPGEIVLMHVGAANDGSTLDADALGRVIDELRRRGYGFVTVRDFVQ